MQELLDPFAHIEMPAPQWIAAAIETLRDDHEGTLQAVKTSTESAVRTMRTALASVPPTIMIAAVTGAIWHRKGPRPGLIAGAALVAIGLLGVWPHAVTTLAVVLTACAICLAIGLPIGVLGAHSDAARAVTTPVLDTMQTIPPFVYLVPVVLIVGIGDAAGVIVTAVFSMPPLIRLTTLGIREVPTDTVRAAGGLGAGPARTLMKVQIPLAWPAIRMGINQMTMMALSMTVIASMIAVGGLGQLVLRGIGSLDMTTAAIGGAGIVLLAITLEQMTEPAARGKSTKPGQAGAEDTPRERRRSTPS